MTPIWHVNAHQGLKQATVVLNPEMKQFVDDHKVLEGIVLIGEVNCERDDAGLRA